MPPSHLTRLVFRQLLAGEPIFYNGCIRQARAPTHAARHVRARPVFIDQQRTFFNILTKPQRLVSEPEMDPGLEVMMHYSKMERLKARVPPPEEVAKSFDEYLVYKIKANSSIPDLQMQHVLRAFRYLQRQDSSELLSDTTLENILKLFSAKQLMRRFSTKPGPHGELALIAFIEIRRRVEAQGLIMPLSTVWRCVRALTTGRKTKQARGILMEAYELKDVAYGNGQSLGQVEGMETVDETFDMGWLKILRGFGLENKEAEILETVAMVRKLDEAAPASHLYAVVSGYYASNDNEAAARTWYERIQLHDPQNRGLRFVDQLHGLHEQLVRFCIRKQNLTWGQSLIRTILSSPPSKNMWDLVFLWAAGSGKGVEEIDRMMDVMLKAQENEQNPRDSKIMIDIETINKLVEVATSRSDPYMAERFIDLGRRRNIHPNVKTLLLQMEYRLSVNDVDGALAAYQHLRSQDLSAGYDVWSTNRLIEAMCGSGQHDFESIMNVAADLSDRRAGFMPSTVATLSILHLSRGEFEDVVDLLNTHIFHFGLGGRARVRDEMVQFCLRPATSTAQAWEAYKIVRQIFDEMDREQRTLLMDEFYRRGRADMAVHVFNHMRTHTRADTMASAETYVSCLRGIAKLKDVESLEAVHNQFKLDYSIEPNTRLLNALILAYTTCGHPRRALGFWDDIAASREGPDMNTMHLAFRACETSPWGDEKAREIWARLQRTGIVFDHKLWASYAAGLVGNGDVAGAIDELEEAEGKGSLTMNSLIIGSLFNAAPGPIKQKEVEDWAQERHLKLWSHLVSEGLHAREAGMRSFNIDRSIEW